MRFVLLTLILMLFLGVAGEIFPGMVSVAHGLGPTATVTPTPTKTPIWKTYEFNLKTANKVAPADILKEVTFYGTGGGELCRDAAYPQPTIGRPIPASEEMLVYVLFSTCGWDKAEKLTGTIRYPDGKEVNTAVTMEQSQQTYAGTIRFKPGVNGLVGKYTFKISGKNKTVEGSVTFKFPTKPRIYKIDDHHLRLYSFVPAEKIKLFYYDGTGALRGWNEYTVGSNGQLEIKTSMTLKKEDLFVAIRANNEEVRMLFDDFFGGAKNWIRESTIKIKSKLQCPNGMPSHVEVGDTVVASHTDGTNLRIRNSPGFDQAVSIKVPEGTKMVIIGGPKCVDNSTWWEIKILDSKKGWVAEYWNGSEYLIELLP